MQHNLWQIANDGNDGGQVRWVVEPQLPQDVLWSIYLKPHPVDWPSTPYLVRCENSGPIEDVPWALDGNFIVSDRFRSVVEELAPLDSRFYPVQMVGSFAPPSEAKYFAMQIVKRVSCINEKLTDWDEVNGNRVAVFPVFDRDAVSCGEGIWRAAECTVYAMASLKMLKALKDAKITGLQLHPIEVS